MWVGVGRGKNLKVEQEGELTTFSQFNFHVTEPSLMIVERNKLVGKEDKEIYNFEGAVVVNGERKE